MKPGTIAKSFFEKLGIKTCTECQNRADEADRRGFIKGSLFLLGLGAMSLLPKSLRAQDACNCIFCTDGEELCLCCDVTCSQCVIQRNERCTLVYYEYCDGMLYIFEVQCPSGTCPGISANAKEQPNLPYKWKMALPNNHAVILSSDHDMSQDKALAWFNRHSKKTKALSASRMH